MKKTEINFYLNKLVALFGKKFSLPVLLFHSLPGAGGIVPAGKVSTINYEVKDNRFEQLPGRLPGIWKKVAPQYK